MRAYVTRRADDDWFVDVHVIVMGADAEYHLGEMLRTFGPAKTKREALDLAYDWVREEESDGK